MSFFSKVTLAITRLLLLLVFKKSMHHRGLFVENGAIVLSQAMVRVADYNY